ncbi:MAG: endonuclease domain-containing protein [Ruminiclostridium sp.]|nr:endonuclease domain-containing protein [Ruminiclostridium sp.]
MSNRLRPNARDLRKEMTREERRLWYDFLKGLPVTVHRQKIIGPYIVDFYIASVKTVIELDGSQHYLDDGPEQDARRDAYLRERGLRVLRYSNRDVNQNFAAVCQDICNQTGILL